MWADRVPDDVLAEWAHTWASLDAALAEHRVAQERLLLRVAASTACPRSPRKGAERSEEAPVLLGDGAAACAEKEDEAKACSQEDVAKACSQEMTAAASAAWDRRVLHLELMTGLDLVKLSVTQERLNKKGGLMARFESTCISLFLWWLHIEEPPRTNRLARFITSPMWEFVVTMMIALNTILLGISTNLEMERAQGHTRDMERFEILEPCFLAFFAVELAMRLIVHRWFFFAYQDMWWNWFDLLVVVMSTTDVFALSLNSSMGNLSFMRSMRVLRLARTLRVVRIFKYASSLRRMLQSVMGSFVSLFWAFTLLIFVFYLFSIVTVQGMMNFLESDAGAHADDQLRDDIMMYFGSVPQAMMTYHMATSGGNDWGQYYDVLRAASRNSAALFVFVGAFTQIALLNIMTGVFVESAMKIAQPDRQSVALEQRKADMQECTELRELLQDMDIDCTGTITWEEFSRIASDARVSAILEVLGLDIKDARLMFEMLCEIEGRPEIDFDLLVGALMKMRGSATSLDLQVMGYKLSHLHSKMSAAHREGIYTYRL